MTEQEKKLTLDDLKIGMRVKASQLSDTNHRHFNIRIFK